jgi:hypothetical protein
VGESSPWDEVTNGPGLRGALSGCRKVSRKVPRKVPMPTLTYQSEQFPGPPPGTVDSPDGWSSAGADGEDGCLPIGQTVRVTR